MHGSHDLGLSGKIVFALTDGSKENISKFANRLDSEYGDGLLVFKR